ncbi:hypothetical protein KY309_01250, partial [Candidatus Woesearchaeota archaeon]|nr:hypothetical protein [Candidatus Woesearchaeota archaeon]
KTKELLTLGAKAREGHPRLNGNIIHYTADLQTIQRIAEETIASDSRLVQTIWLETGEGADLRIKETIEKTPKIYEIINRITASPARVIENLKTLDEALKNV